MRKKSVYLSKKLLYSNINIILILIYYVIYGGPQGEKEMYSSKEEIIRNWEFSETWLGNNK